MLVSDFCGIEDSTVRGEPTDVNVLITKNNNGDNRIRIIVRNM